MQFDSVSHFTLTKSYTPNSKPKSRLDPRLNQGESEMPKRVKLKASRSIRTLRHLTHYLRSVFAASIRYSNWWAYWYLQLFNNTTIKEGSDFCARISSICSTYGEYTSILVTACFQILVVIECRNYLFISSILQRIVVDSPSRAFTLFHLRVLHLLARLTLNDYSEVSCFLSMLKTAPMFSIYR